DLPEAQPVVDGVGGNAQFCGGLFDADFTVSDCDGTWSMDGVGVADASNAGLGPAVTAAGAQPLRVEDFCQLLAGVGSAVAADQLQCGGWGAAGSDPAGGDLIGGAGVPAHSDSDFV